MDEISTPSSEISRLRIYHSCLWQQHSPYEACSASYMALAPSVHIATHFGQGISCSRKHFFYLQAAAYRIETPPASHFGRQITEKLKAERRLTHRRINLIVVQNNLPSAVLRIVVPSHQLPIHQSGGHWDAFQFFLRTHRSQTLFCTYH